MFIINQSKDKVWNLNNFDAVELQGPEICIEINSANGDCCFYTIGKYATEERAAEVFKQMLDEVFAPPMMVLQNVEMTPECEDMVRNAVLMVKASDDQPTKIEKLEVNCWYMPEE